MINIVTKELELDTELKKKVEFLCSFCNTTPTIINGTILKILENEIYKGDFVHGKRTRENKKILNELNDKAVNLQNKSNKILKL